jgi:capsule polysaccharide export protein KpsE/RkpR
MTPDEILAIIASAASLIQLGTQTVQQIQADGSAQTTSAQLAAFQASHANLVLANSAWQAALAAQGVNVTVA